MQPLTIDEARRPACSESRDRAPSEGSEGSSANQARAMSCGRPTVTPSDPVRYGCAVAHTEEYVVQVRYVTLHQRANAHTHAHHHLLEARTSKRDTHTSRHVSEAAYLPQTLLLALTACAPSVPSHTQSDGPTSMERYIHYFTHASSALRAGVQPVAQPGVQSGVQ